MVFLASGSMPFGNHGMAALFLVFFPHSLSGDEISLSSSLEFFVFPLSFHSLNGVRDTAAASFLVDDSSTRLSGTFLSI